MLSSFPFSPAPIAFLEGMKPLLTRYDGFLVDLWGVIHDGTALYPAVAETLAAMREQGKRVIFLSNAPRRAFEAEKVLARLGIPREHFEWVVTSGEVAHHWLKEEKDALTFTRGRNYAFMGPERDRGLCEGLPFQEVPLEQADFLLNVGLRDDNEQLPVWVDFMKHGLTKNLPMICGNPDIEVVKQNGQRLLCAGALAEWYQARGGEVRQFGKPYPEVYQRCLQLLDPLPVGRVLAIGDNLHTDILGANRAGIDSALVSGGVLRNLLPPGNRNSYRAQSILSSEAVKEKANPTYCIPAFTL
jgi:HAD superfamily hydrolase (TIGR01459 family)